MLAYIGTYTRMGGPGIAVVEVGDDALRILSEYRLEDASYLIANSAFDRLYAVCRDAAAEFAVDGAKLTLVSTAPTGASGPCHLCLSPDEEYLYTANYQSGTLSAFKARGLTRIQLIRHEGRGPNAERQERAHAHHVSFAPGSGLLFAVDLGMDAVIGYAPNADGTLRQVSRLDVAPGLGPRHIAWLDGETAYLGCELGNVCLTLKRSGETLSVVQTLSTTPEGETGGSTVAAVRIREHRVYVSNRGFDPFQPSYKRGMDSVAEFAIGGDGLLSKLGVHKTGGVCPRDVYPLSGGRMLIAHQSGSLTLSRLGGSGLTPLCALPIGGSVCVLPRES